MTQDSTTRENGSDSGGGLRLDKWLWHARACRTRSLATQLVAAGRVRVNGSPTDKPHYRVRPGDVLTFPQGDHLRVWKVLSLPARRGGAAVMAGVYEDLKPPTPGNRLASDRPTAPAPSPAGRPDRRARRALRALRESE